MQSVTEPTAAMSVLTGLYVKIAQEMGDNHEQRA